jgi:hypothetical protein
VSSVDFGPASSIGQSFATRIGESLPATATRRRRIEGSVGVHFLIEPRSPKLRTTSKTGIEIPPPAYGLECSKPSPLGEGKEVAGILY